MRFDLVIVVSGFISNFLIMNKSLIFTYISLLLFTLITAVLSIYLPISKLLISLVLGFATVKFLLVVYQFMELKKANIFWIMSVLLTLGLLVLLLLFLKK